MPNTVLAQNAVAPLPDPSLIPKLLFEQPMLLSLALIVLGVAAFSLLNRKGNVKRASIFGGIGLLLAVAVQILAAAVETGREKIIAVTTPLVKATAAADTARLDPLLDANVKLTNERGLMSGELPIGESWGKPRILSEVSKQLGEKWRLKECDVLEVQGVIDSPGFGRTQVRVRAVLDEFTIPVTSVWRLDWKETGGGQWVVTGIEPIDLGFLSRFR